MRCLFRVCVVITVCCMCVIYDAGDSSNKTLARDVPVELALDILRNLEKRISAISFSTVSVANPPLMSERTVLYDWSSGKYKMETHRTSNWIGGQSEYISCVEKISFDGIVYREWQVCIGGISLPDTDVRSEGVITKDMSDSFLNKSFEQFKNGIGIGFPLLFYNLYAPYYEQKSNAEVLGKPTYLSEYIDHWKKNGSLVSIEEDSQDTWIITVQHNSIFANIIRLVITYNLKMGGYVTHIRYFCTPHGNKDQEKLFLENEYVVDVENIDNEWVPVRLRKIILENEEELLFVYRDVVVIADPRLLEFSFEFPNGTTVDDHITRKHYRVGNLIDEDQAIDDFMKRHGFTGDVTLQRQKMTPMRYLFVGIGIILIIFALYRLLMQWTRKQ